MRLLVIGAVIGLVFLFAIGVTATAAWQGEAEVQMIDHSHPSATEGGDHSHGFELRCVVTDD